jgi:putative hydroxymethylpyrimidine transport system substrate-binding protein
MRRVAASLAAVLCALAAVGCGDGAEPGAPEGATLMLDFTPNAVHTGIYVAQHRGYFEEEGIDLTIREPSSTSDAPKLLEAGRVDFAVMDINDLGIASTEGFQLQAVGAVVQVPLAAVIAGDRDDVRTPADLEGKAIGVTGVPSDDAALDSVLESGGADPAAVRRVNIGFNAVPAISSGRVDAATAFWNAEGVQLRQLDVPTREFRVADEPGVRFPELVLAVSEQTERERPKLVAGVLRALDRSYRVLDEDRNGALGDLIAEVAGIDRPALAPQLAALRQADAFAEFSKPAAKATPRLGFSGFHDWISWAVANGLFRDDQLDQLLDLIRN